MAEDSRNFQVEIITPDRIFYKGQATMLEFNTTAGELGVYKNHIPLTTVLAPGILRIHGCDGEDNASRPQGQPRISPEGGKDVIAAVHSGFAEILPEKVTLLAEIAEWPEEIDKSRAKAAKARAEERLAQKTETTDIKRAEFALRKALVRIDITK